MIEIIESSLRLSTPLILAAMGGLLCEKAGVATICLEGALLAGAWVCAVVAYYTGSAWFSLIPCVLAGSLVLGLHAILSLVAKANHIVSGLVVNLLISGTTPLLCKWMFVTPTNTPSLSMDSRFHALHFSVLSDAPWVGFLFRQMPLTYFAVLTPIALHYLIGQSRWGLRLIASGEDPITLLSCGVKPNRIRIPALCLGGAICALGGAFLSISHASQFTRDMTSGRGYIALTALIFGNWRPFPTLFACCLFGFADALQIRLQSTTLLPIQFIQALPYLVTLMVLVGFAGKSRPPAGIGK